MAASRLRNIGDSGFNRQSVKDMADLSSILWFSALAVLALGLIRLSNRQQHKSELLGRKIVQLKQRVELLEETLRVVEPLTETLAVPKLINSEIIDLLSMLQKLDGVDQAIIDHLEDAQVRDEDLSDPARPRKLYRVLKCDADIARAQYLISETARLTQVHRRLNKINENMRKTLLADLRWAHVMVATLSLVAQGHKALTRGDIPRANAYYKTAHHTLITSAVDDERRTRLAAELEDILTGRRGSVSPDLMPETDYNPPQGSPGLDANVSASG